MAGLRSRCLVTKNKLRQNQLFFRKASAHKFWEIDQFKLNCKDLSLTFIGHFYDIFDSYYTHSTQSYMPGYRACRHSLLGLSVSTSVCFVLLSVPLSLFHVGAPYRFAHNFHVIFITWRHTVLILFDGCRNRKEQINKIGLILICIAPTLTFFAKVDASFCSISFFFPVKLAK